MVASHTTSAKLHFILARSAPAAVIFRRGPRKLVQIIKWNTHTDTFEQGQWFKGRIYEDRSDISPDGTKLVYFAEKITPATLKNPDYTTHWTAVSKLPYLTALALWPNGDHTCKSNFIQGKDVLGGGIFFSDTELLLDFGFAEIAPHRDHVPQGMTVRNVHNLATSLDYLQTHMESWSDEQFDQYVELLNQIISHGEIDRHGWHYVPAKITPFGRLFKERLASGTAIDRKWLLEATSSVRGMPTIPHTDNPGTQRKVCGVQSGVTLVRTTVSDKVHHFKVIAADANEHEIPDASWADWDQSGRLVFVRDGKVFSAEVNAAGIVERELADFNANKFEPIEAPEWAKSWL